MKEEITADSFYDAMSDDVSRGGERMTIRGLMEIARDKKPINYWHLVALVEKLRTLQAVIKNNTRIEIKE